MAIFPRKRPRSIRARTTAGSVVAAAVILAFAIAATSLLIRAVIEREQTLEAGEAAREVAVDIQNRRLEGEIRARAGVIRIQVVSPDGEVLASSRAAPTTEALTGSVPRRANGPVGDVVCDADPVGCLTVVGYESADSAYGDVLVYAAVPRSDLLAGPLLEFALIGLGLAVLASVGGISWWQVGRTLRPVEEVRSGLERITASHPDKRLQVPGTGDEIAALARTANETLRRLDIALDRQRGFASDASHELRNPIAGLRVRLELELDDPEGGDQAEVLRAALEDTLRLERIVADLLELARLDADAAAAGEFVDLGELAAAEVERRGGSLRIDSRVERGAYVFANRLQLARLLVNLLANAERHAAGRVLVDVAREDEAEGGGGHGDQPEGWAVLHVHDDGHGIPEHDRERIFDRFARLEESRRRDPGGTGLGLAISRETAQALGGTLKAGASDVLGGAVFTLRLPLYRDGGRGSDRDRQ
ncbi:sensor histidine kinase [Streptomonospora wellingtoniae]|uniref:histidine kinase n=1 Tax=Streptomonospora wellingtoniae TaxID=3075544 RepID=A0ABU2L0P1_9ACTN|nr:HAMP domain-containing sensor histidine kinase [Streptomonospora sp. DSM 45055]MDT0305124.1 HAMP domain-containing sensor histidine kinase [Streptomonospora sp. DSM 45055]